MELKVLEKSKDKVKLEMSDITFVNLINDKLWDSKKSDYSAWKRDHPYIAKPEFMVKAKDPKAALLQAAEDIADDAEKIKSSFQKQVR